ncbi:MAG: propionyl-CoA synthetase [Deltaproteobacteria bacterium]
MTSAESNYAAVYTAAADDPETFWRAAAERIHWEHPPEHILDGNHAPIYRWFAGGKLNTAYNALDRHVDGGRGDQLALIWDSPLADAKLALTYTELRDRVARFAGALAAQGVEKGDRVLIYMPMVPETAVAMLACARLGAVHSVVFGGFASAELAKRIDDAAPKLVVSASCGIEPTRVVEYKPLLDAAIDMSRHRPARCIILQRPQATAELVEGRDLTWDAALEGAEPHDCVMVDATDPLYVLYTSGTTGEPKGVVRDNGGHAVALSWSLEHVYGVRPGDVFWSASDVGWVVGHSYIVYAPLILGATTIMYEGKPVGTPDPGAFWRVIEEYGVRVFFTAPTAFRAIRQQDPNGEHIGRYDLSKFEALFLAGERCDPDTLNWARESLGVDVIDHWWQTETGWPMVANCLGIEKLPVKPGSSTRPVPGWRVEVLDDLGRPVEANVVGNIVVRLPLPPGALPTLWNADQRFIDAYLSRFDGYYQTADAGYLDEDGYLFIMSRTDDVINVAGHRLSTGAIEEVLAEVPDVAECAVVGATDELKGQRPLALLVLDAKATRSEEEIEAECKQRVRDRIGPIASLSHVLVVKRLPKTRSGKILRRTMRAIADEQPYDLPATIDDPAILDEISSALDRTRS